MSHRKRYALGSSLRRFRLVGSVERYMARTSRLVGTGSVVVITQMASVACDGTAQEERVQAETTTPAGHQQAAQETAATSDELMLTLQTGKQVKLSDYRGKHVVLYFYPKDDTPGCRVEAQGFRDLHDQFVKRGAVVLGVSTQDAASHQAFIAKEQLPFDLVVDRDGTVARAFDVPLMMGTLASRQTVLLDRDGKVLQKWDKVSPSDHPSEVLAALN